MLSVATNPRFRNDLDREMRRRAIRRSLQTRQQFSDLGPTGNALSNFGSALGEISDRRAQRREEEKQAQLDMIADRLMNSGMVPGIPQATVTAVRPDASPEEMAAAMGDYHQGGQSELALLQAIGAQRVKEDLARQMLATRMQQRSGGQDLITQRMLLRDAQRQQAGDERAAAQAERDMMADTAVQVARDAKAMGIDLPEVTAGIPRVAGQEVIYRVPKGETGQLPLRSPLERPSWLPNWMTGAEDPQVRADVPLYERKTAPLATVGALLERQRAIGGDDPMVTSRARKGPYMSRGDFLALQAQQNPAVARGRQARGVPAAGAMLPPGTDPLPEDAGTPAPPTIPLMGRRESTMPPTPIAEAPLVQSDADFERLPSGAVFIGPDGKKRRKP